eukprot:CAMPEP_0177605576 /NCGR_PEP_ID=MMETSP0419_2-20121207/16783_1 /TAXON_ID=582737 /ORGANISM="Tetraselmis sp., Strain GSL018" /LENGTH=249 /DNA_ID=CAMNT_0019099751 /DNA_START=374 /DNA_END=1123 /DNA_ORIENTATION=+
MPLSSLTAIQANRPSVGPLPANPSQPRNLAHPCGLFPCLAQAIPVHTPKTATTESQFAESRDGYSRGLSLAQEELSHVAPEPYFAGRWGILSRALEAAVRSAPSWLLGALSRVPSRLPRLSYRVMVLTGLGEAGVSYGTAVSWARHLAAMDPDSFRSFLLAAQAHSLDEDTLSRIDAPVLVVSGGRDVFSPPVHSERLVRGLRRARRLHLEAASHMGLAGHATVLLEAIKDFVKDLQAETPGVPSGRSR